eukprot:COSAG05_NODE_4196_length_1628_cov_1.367560_4_plen_56_part_01
MLIQIYLADSLSPRASLLFYGHIQLQLAALDDAMRSGSVPEVTGDPETAPREKAWV